MPAQPAPTNAPAPAPEAPKPEVETTAKDEAAADRPERKEDESVEEYVARLRNAQVEHTRTDR